MVALIVVNGASHTREGGALSGVPAVGAASAWCACPYPRTGP